MHFSDIGRTLRYLKRNGIKETGNAVRERLHERDSYVYEGPSEQEIKREQADNGDITANISIVVPAYDTDPRYMKALLESVISQTYKRWELVIADAGDNDSVYATVKHEIANGNTEGILLSEESVSCGTLSDAVSKECADKFVQGMIRYVKLDQNNGISENTNEALKYVRGDYVCFLDHDDMLTADALYRTAEAIAANDSPALLYSDEDKTDQAGSKFSDVNKKCKFNFDMVLSNNYICHLMTMKREMFKNIRFRQEYDGAQDYDIVLQSILYLISNGTETVLLGRQMVHIPYVLYHWRIHPQSTAGNTASKGYAYEAGRRALETFYTEMQIQASVSHSKHLGFYETRFLPNIFSARPDAGAVCGRVFDDRCMISSCLADDEGVKLFCGMKNGESGYMHRFDIAQDVGTADVRCMKLRRSLWTEFEAATGQEYCECENSGLWDYDSWSDRYAAKHDDCRPDPEYVSKRFSEYLHRKGYLIIYEPSLSTYVK